MRHLFSFVLAVVFVSVAVVPAQSSDYQWKRRREHPYPGSLLVRDEARGVSVMLESHWEGSDLRFVTWEWLGDRWVERTDAVLPQIFKRQATWSLFVTRPAVATFDPSTNKVLVFGCDVQGAARTWLYDGDSWSLAATGGPAARVNAGLAPDFSSGTAVLFGGQLLGNGDVLGDTWTWNGSAWSLAASASAPGVRSNVEMAFDPATGRVAMFGGYAANGSFAGITTVHEWNSSTWLPIPTAPPVDVQPNHAASMPGDSGCYVMLRAQGLAVPTLQRWNGSTWATVLGSGLTSHENFAVEATDRLLVVDGLPSMQVRTRSFDPGAAQWQTLRTFGAPSGSIDFTTVESQDALILRKGLASTCEFWRFDQDGTLTHLLTAPQTNSNPRLMAWHPPSGYVVSVNPFTGDTQSFTGTAVIPGGTQPGVTGRRYLAGFHPSSGMVLALAKDASNQLQIWGFAPSSWTLLATGPVMTGDPIGAHDGARDRFVFWDRNGVSGEWDGTAFHSIAPPPPAVAGYMMRPHPDGGVAVFEAISSTWTAIHRWNGATWTTSAIVDPRNDPDLGDLHYDVARRRWVMWNGEFRDLESTALTSDAPAPLPGTTITYSFDRPASAGKVWLVALSTSTTPAIPWRAAPAYGTEVIPIASDWLVDASLDLGMFGVLDAQGQGQVQLTIPNLPLVGFHAYAVALTLGATQPFEFVSAPVPLTIGN